MTMLRWYIENLDGTGRYTFGMSPNSMESPLPVRTITTHGTSIHGVKRGTRADARHDWSFSGVVRDQAAYDAMESWLGVKAHLGDHLGRVFVVRLTKFDATRAPTLYAPWRHVYKMSATTYGGLQ